MNLKTRIKRLEKSIASGPCLACGKQRLDPMTVAKRERP